MCPNLEGCPFINNTDEALQNEINIFKSRYCTKDYEKCARYIVCTNGGDVPDELKPNDAAMARIILKG